MSGWPAVKEHLVQWELTYIIAKGVTNLLTWSTGLTSRDWLCLGNAARSRWCP
jgi:hypothetical protein